MQDYGPEGVFAAMQGQCVEMVIEKYTYSVCPFGQATQQDAGARTSLGKFERFSDDYSAMHFTNVRFPAACCTVPARRLRSATLCLSAHSCCLPRDPRRRRQPHS